MKKGNQRWLYLDPRDENGSEISSVVNSVDIIATLKNGSEAQEGAGVCMNAGSNTWVTCSEINYTDYSSIWEGRDSFVLPAADYELPVTFGDAPTEEGITQK